MEAEGIFLLEEGKENERGCDDDKTIILIR